MIILYVLIIYLIILILLILLQLYECDNHNNENRTLLIDGFKIFKHDNKHEIIKELSNNYIYIDYKYEIKGCTLSTFHRDVTSSQYIYKTKYPVYTHIIYYNAGPLLSICPSSHITAPLLLTSPVIIYGTPGTSILFNCDLVHAGALNNLGSIRHAIQYKLCHKEDLPKLKHLIGINKSTYGICNTSHDNYVYLLRKVSLFFSYVFNHLFTSLLQDKPKKDTIFDYIISNFYIGDFYNK
jgi:hypothetical protein